jgi:nucleotide-binding universal stress UspA family protein
MHNLLVGYDGSRHSEVAVRQAADLASILGARLHLHRALEPTGPENLTELSPSSDPLALIDRMDALTAEDDAPRLQDDEFPATVTRACEDAGAVTSYKAVHGTPVRTLRERSVAMDLLVLGRHGRTGRLPIGATASSVVSRPIVPTLLCRDTLIPWGDVLVAYESSPHGGRALKIAADLSARLNVNLDVIIADPERDKLRKLEDYVSTVLRAYHLEGDRMRHEGKLAEALGRASLQFQSSVVVVPDGHNSPWPWSRSETLHAAIQFPAAMALVVP